MAELDTSGGGKKGKKVRSKKQSTRVDLTAMVDLAFLLITFFMLTTSLSKPLAMPITKPDPDEKNPEATMDFPASRTMTVLLAKEGKVAWYMGVVGDETPTIEKMTQIRSSLIDMRKKVAAANNNDPKKPFIVIVKPTSGAKYKDFVNMMDEIKIAGVETVAIEDVKFDKLEIDLLKSQKLL